MLSAADCGEFDILLVDDLSRLARDQVERARAIRRLEFHGIRIVATADGHDSQTKTGARGRWQVVGGL
jgi:site-specific DNA recombinase